MSGLTHQRRAALRMRLNDYHASMRYAPPTNEEIGALLDAADERDRLREELARLRPVYKDCVSYDLNPSREEESDASS